MLTLALDTATKVCAAALCRGREILAEYTVNAGMTHSEGLLPQLDELFRRARVSKRDLGLVAVSMGPGSFTGLRIGLASAEAIAYSLGACLHGVSTLEALAYNAPIEGLLLSPVLDAQKGNYYQALYLWEGERLKAVAEAKVVSVEELFERIALQGTKALLLGECARLAGAGLPEWARLAPEALRMPRASSVAFAAQDAFDPTRDKQVFGLEPYYIRRSEAEELWEKRMKT